MTGVSLLEKHDEPLWDDFVRKHEEATLFHSSRWKEVVERSLGHNGYYLYHRQDGNIKGILPLFLCASLLTDRALVALPFAGTQPSIFTTDSTSQQVLIDSALELGRKLDVDYIELREDSEKSWPWVHKQNYVNVRLPLSPDPEEVWRNSIESRVRTKVRAAERRGLHVEWGGIERVDDFYSVYAETLHRLGSPAHSEQLFQNVINIFRGQAEFALVMDDQLVVAGALVMHDNCWIGFPWAASCTEARSKHPNNLLYWAIIKRACEQGYTALDLGRSPANSGTLHFKLQWGGIARPLWYYFGLLKVRQAPNRDALDPKMIFASRCWRNLPMRLATRMGPSLARLIP